MGVEPEDAEVGVAPRLGGDDRDRRAVVPAHHRQQRAAGDGGQGVGDRGPAGLDLGTRVEVAEVVDGHPEQLPAVLGDRGHHRAQAADPLRRLGRPLPIGGRPVVGDAADHDVGFGQGGAGQPGPGQEPGEVHHRMRSRTFRTTTDPAIIQAAKSPNITG